MLNTFINVSYKTLFDYAKEEFKKEGIKEAVNDAYIMLFDVFMIDRAKYLMISDEVIKDNELIDKFLEFVSLRKNRIPVSIIIGKWEFMGLEFKVSKDVLTPRQDTERLVELSIDIINKEKYKKVLDMCTGTGCIAISLKKNVSNLEVTAADVSDKALEIARINDEKHKTNIKFVKSDLFNEFDSGKHKFDMIISNPPYIKTKEIESLMPEVKENEPILALDGKEDGLEFYRVITKNAKNYLVPGGTLIYEIGHDQAQDLVRIMTEQGYTDCEIFKDYANNDRVVKARFK